jgi:3-hydroxyacyl-[acyl-carrier-protein] dehydratase
MTDFDLPMGRDAIMRVLPHRPPFLYVDTIEELVPGKSVVATLYVDPAWTLFEGHFPGEPVMPGVIILEATAQAGAVPLLVEPEFAGRLPLFAGANKIRFKRPVRPGETLRLEVDIQWVRRGIGLGVGTVSVGDATVATGEITFALRDMTG